MRVIAEIGVERDHPRTLADLDEGVMARCKNKGTGETLIRWRDEDFVMGVGIGGRIIVINVRKPREYEVLEVLGMLTLRFEG